MNEIAYIFPGQGAQAVGMGRALYDASPEARDVIDRAAAALSGEVDLKTLLFEGPEDALKRTANTQPAILTVSVAAHAALAARRPDLAPAFVAGHSLGEYSALVAAGTLRLEDAVLAVRRRGTFMQEAVPEGEGAMAAVLALGSEAVREVCEEISTEDALVAPANYNAPDQTVIAGHAAAVARAADALKAKGARRVMPLPVSAPFHCALMAPVQPRLERVLEGLVFEDPKIPLVSNVEAVPVADAARIRALLVAQVTSPVRWVESVRALAEAGVTTLVELGPGKVLSGLVRRIDKGLVVHNVDDPASLDATLEALG